jgi:DNA-binding Lrp family transcriptional regulator
VDEVDEAIVALLEADGRLTHGEVARAVGLSRSAAAARVQRLIGSGRVVVRGVVHPAVLGRGSLAYVALAVHGPAAPVAEAVAERDDVAFVSLTTGRHGVVAEVRAESPLAVDQAIAQLRTLDHVHGVDTLVYVEVVRDVVGPVGAVDHVVDGTDLALLRALQDDGRASFVDLAALARISAAGARRRVLRMLEAQVVRVGALVRPSGQDGRSAMGVGLRLHGDQDAVVAVLGRMASVTFVARTLGRFDLLVSMRAPSTAQLVDAVEALRALPEVHEVESWTHLRVVKESYALGQLGAAVPGPA